MKATAEPPKLPKLALPRRSAGEKAQKRLAALAQTVGVTLLVISPEVAAMKAADPEVTPSSIDARLHAVLSAAHPDKPNLACALREYHAAVEKAAPLIATILEEIEVDMAGAFSVCARDLLAIARAKAELHLRVWYRAESLPAQVERTDLLQRIHAFIDAHRFADRALMVRRAARAGMLLHECRNAPDEVERLHRSFRRQWEIAVAEYDRLAAEVASD